MTLQLAESRLLKTLDDRHTAGKPARFWLRDDDAVEPSAALDRYLAIVAKAGVPVTLAVIPEHTGTALVERLNREPGLTVALHGWSHVNHAPATEKKQELGAHRPAETVLSELKAGFDKLSSLYPSRFIPMLVPPWNRVSPALLPHLQGLGIRCLSVFGPEQARGLPELNTHVDVMDWHGTRGGRDAATLLTEITARIETMGDAHSMGLLTHHLVHDRAVDDFLARLFALTAGHPGCSWVSAAELMSEL